MEEGEIVEDDDLGRFVDGEFEKSKKNLDSDLESGEIKNVQDNDSNLENIANRLSRMNSNTSPNSSQDFHGKELIDDAKNDKKRGRGASKLNLVSGQQNAKELERNEFGQPIGDNSVKYAFFLGCMVKEFVPYTLDRWNDLDGEIKNKMWCCLKLNYKVEEWEKLGKLLRDRKSKLQILIREVDAGRMASRDLSLLKPEFMDQNQWNLFVKKTLSPTFQEKSAKSVAMRKKQRYNHTMNMRGYARLTHIMEKTSRKDTPITRTKVWVEGHKKKNGEPSSEAVAEKMVVSGDGSGIENDIGCDYDINRPKKMVMLIMLTNIKLQCSQI